MRKVFCGVKTKRRSSGQSTGATLQKIVSVWDALANTSACVASVVLDAHLPACEKVRHRRHCLFRILSARAHRQDEIAEGELLTRFEDLIGLFHILPTLFGALWVPERSILFLLGRTISSVPLPVD